MSHSVRIFYICISISNVDGCWIDAIAANGTASHAGCGKCSGSSIISDKHTRCLPKSIKISFFMNHEAYENVSRAHKKYHWIEEMFGQISITWPVCEFDFEWEREEDRKKIYKNTRNGIVDRIVWHINRSRTEVLCTLSKKNFSVRRVIFFSFAIRQRCRSLKQINPWKYLSDPLTIGMDYVFAASKKLDQPNRSDKMEGTLLQSSPFECFFFILLLLNVFVARLCWLKLRRYLFAPKIVYFRFYLGHRYFHSAHSSSVYIHLCVPVS